MSGHGVFDYIVAGGGSAGCTLAARLAQAGDASVLLVEAGGGSSSLFSRMPAGNGFLFGNPRHDWGFQSTPQPGLGGRRIYYPRGRGLGGSSLMNGMIYIRGNAADYDRWRQMGLAGWSYGDVLPYFRRSAGARHRPGDPFHGTDGPLKLSPARRRDAINERFVAACLEAGAPFNDDFNGATQEGAGWFDTKVWRGIRQSSARAYLEQPPGNLTILADSPVLRIAMEGSRAVGLVLATGKVRARREVVLCLGAFGSPQCLMLSGIGPADHLRDHGIDVALDLPGVGARLADHPNMPLQFGLLRPELSMARHQRIDRAAWMGLRWLLARSGPGAGPFWSTALFHAVRDHAMPELEIFFTPMVVREEGGAKRLSIQTLLSAGKAVIARGKTAEPGLQFDINLLRPASSGTLRLASGDPRDAPLIDPRYFSDPADLEDLEAGVRHMRRVVAQPALAGIAGAERSPGAGAVSDGEIRQAIRALATTGHHPVATCRMGGDHDTGAVLDAELRVRGIDGLRVADASSFPDQISGNTGAAVIMLAEKAADMMLGRPAPAPEDPRAVGA